MSQNKLQKSAIIIESTSGIQPKSILFRSNDDIADFCRNNVLADTNWHRVSYSPASRAQCEGYRASCDLFNNRVFYLKPIRTNNNSTMATAAREKLASDLADLLDVKVPPTILIRDLTAGSRNESIHIVASLVMFDSQHSWTTIDPLKGMLPFGPIKDCIDQRLPNAAQAWVFDTWLAQEDHGDFIPNHNVILGSEKDINLGFDLLFLDYEMALGASPLDFDPNSWRTPPRKIDTLKVSKFPEYLRVGICSSFKDVLLATANQIASLEEDQIRALVERIPSDFLDETTKVLIFDNLMVRRSVIVDTFDRLVNQSSEEEE